MLRVEKRINVSRDAFWLKKMKLILEDNNKQINFLLYLLYENQKRIDRTIEHLEGKNEKQI